MCGSDKLSITDVQATWPFPPPQCLTTPGWDFIMYRAMDTASPFAVIYFLLVIMFGTYLLTNLIIAVSGMLPSSSVNCHMLFPDIQMCNPHIEVCMSPRFQVLKLKFARFCKLENAKLEARELMRKVWMSMNNYLNGKLSPSAPSLITLLFDHPRARPSA